MDKHNNSPKEFEDIRCMHDWELPQVVESLLANREAIKFIKSFDISFDTRIFVPKLRAVQTVTQCQIEVMAPLFEQIIDRSVTELTVSGIERVPQDRAVVFMSNHRDIVLDSALINILLSRHGRKMGNAGIGNNLLMNPTISNIFKLLKCFFIRRDLAGKEQIKYLRRVSTYIYHTVTNLNESIWIAQDSGRAKDGNDKTNTAILKMLSMSKTGDAIDHLRSLCLVPVSCSYEWDPCDLFKVREVLSARQNVTYVKAENEDMVSIHAGICESKGRIHIAFGEPLLDTLTPCAELPSKEKFSCMASLVDHFIWSQYRLWPPNYIAADLLSNSDRFADHYSKAERLTFLDRLSQRVPDSNPDSSALKQLFLSFYANPLHNQLSCREDESPTDRVTGEDKRRV